MQDQHRPNPLPNEGKYPELTKAMNSFLGAARNSAGGMKGVKDMLGRAAEALKDEQVIMKARSSVQATAQAVSSHH